MSFLSTKGAGKKKKSKNGRIDEAKAGDDEDPNGQKEEGESLRQRGEEEEEAGSGDTRRRWTGWGCGVARGTEEER